MHMPIKAESPQRQSLDSIQSQLFPGVSVHVFNLVFFSSSFSSATRGLLCLHSFTYICDCLLSPSYHFELYSPSFLLTITYSCRSCNQPSLLIFGIPNGYFSVLNFLDSLAILLTTASVLIASPLPSFSSRPYTFLSD